MKKTRIALIASAFIGLIFLLWITFPRVEPYEITFRRPTKLMSEPIPDPSFGNSSSDSPSKVLAVLESGSTARVIGEWQAKKFRVFKVKSPAGAVGYVFSQDQFMKTQAAHLGE